MKRYFSSGCETGHTAEEEILGSCKVRWDGRMYLCFRDAMTMAREGQPFDPKSPSLVGARILHDAVASAMHLTDGRELCLYTAINTPLDRFHGVDGWFEFRGKVVTIDLTLQEQKNYAKADFVVHANELEHKFRFIADEIAQAFHWLTKSSVRTGGTCAV